jgi:hypothetical protein
MCVSCCSTCDSRETRFRSLLGPVPVSSVLLSVELLLLFVWMALRFLVSWLFRVGGMAGSFATVDLCRSFVGILDFHLSRIGIAGTLVSPAGCLQPLVVYAVLSNYWAAVKIRAIKGNAIMV